MYSSSWRSFWQGHPEDVFCGVCRMEFWNMTIYSVYMKLNVILRLLFYTRSICKRSNSMFEASLTDTD
jgi:hypothetical protein